MTKDQIAETGKLLEKSFATAHSHVRSHWRDVEFRVLKDDWDLETARLFVNEAEKPVIRIYPCMATFSPEKQAFYLMREFGDYLLTCASDDMELAWRQKLVLATVEQIDSFQKRLNDSYNNYAEVVESFKTPVDRLVAMNLANALMANGQAYKGSGNVNVREWGPTQEFANLRRYFSMVPLTSAYCPRDIHKDFGCAFASYVVFDLKTVLHTSVQETLKRLIERIIDSAR
jgi:hypothetical protein